MKICTIALASAAVIGFAAGAAQAQEAVSFEDKTVTMIIGYAAGGGTDTVGRLVARFFAKHLPGNPTVIVRNVPGADGTIALNYMIKQTKPDGLTVTTGSSTQIDPLNYRKPQADYDPTKFPFVGGMGQKGTGLLIRSDAVTRLADPQASPVIMGSVGALPRSGMQITAWGIELLGWNAKWVVGYPGTNELMIALERGEIDMTSVANTSRTQQLVKSGKYRVFVQPGVTVGGKTLPVGEFADAPVFSDLLQGKVTDPLAQKAFDYWRSINSIDKWIGLLPDTPPAIVDSYRAALQRAAGDPEFIEVRAKITEDTTPVAHQDIELLVATIAATPNDAMEYVKIILRKQGVQVQ